MKCIVCGKQSNRILCDECIKTATEELCYKIAQYNYNNSDNDLWRELSEELDKPYMFKDYAFEVAELIGGSRVDFIKINCMNMRSSDLGIFKEYYDYLLETEEQLLTNDNLTEDEKDLIRALVFEIYVSRKQWDKVDESINQIHIDGKFLEPLLIIADYYIKIRNYEHAEQILLEGKDTYTNETDIKRIETLLEDCNARRSGTKKHWKPNKADEIKNFYEYLDKQGIEHEVQGNGSKKNKINLKDFKPFIYLEDSVPNTYVALWLTTEFYQKQREIVEINAVRISDGEIKDQYHSFVKPVNTPKSVKKIDPNDLLNAQPIRNVFPTFLEFLRNDIIAIAGAEEQCKYLSRLARYSMMDHIDNLIFDVIAYYEDNSDDFDLYTRESLLSKFDLSEGNGGMEKALVTAQLIEKIRE